MTNRGGRSPGAAGSSGPAPATVRLFGAIEVEMGAQRLGPRDFGGRKAKQIFEVLALARGAHVPKDRLADVLWGEDRLPANVAATIETHVSTLRRALGSKGRTLIETLTEAYRFAPSRLDLDLDSFDHWLHRASQETGIVRRRCLEEALGLVAGPVLADEPYADWATRVRGSYQTRVIQALVEAAEEALLAGDAQGGLARAERATEMDPLFERAVWARIAAQYALGWSSQALRGVADAHETFARELGSAPSDRIDEIARQIERGVDAATVIESIGAAAGSPQTTGRPTRWRPLRLLLVEDNPVDVQLISAVMDAEGSTMDLSVTRNGDEAIRFLRRDPGYEDAPRPDLVLLDLHLPKKSGIEVLEEIKGDDELARLPVIVLTGSTSEQDILRCYDLHANSFITKPAELDEYVEVIRALESYWPTVTSPPRS